MKVSRKFWCCAAPLRRALQAIPKTCLSFPAQHSILARRVETLPRGLSPRVKGNTLNKKVQRLFSYETMLSARGFLFASLGKKLMGDLVDLHYSNSITNLTNKDSNRQAGLIVRYGSTRSESKLEVKGSISDILLLTAATGFGRGYKYLKSLHNNFMDSIICNLGSLAHVFPHTPVMDYEPTSLFSEMRIR